MEGEDSGVRQWWRSADMEYISIVLQEHCAHKVLSRLGRLGVVQFTDLNSEQTVFQRRYVKEVQRCDTVERKLKYLEEQLETFDVPRSQVPDVEDFLNRVEQRNTGGESVSRDQTNYMDNLEMHVDEKESELVQLNKYNATLSADYYAQVELQNILEKARNYASDDDQFATGDAQSVPVNNDLPDSGQYDGGDSLRFRFIAGVVNQENRGRFERMVFRSTRGNCLMRFYDIEEPLVDVVTSLKTRKEVFIIFFQASYIENKIKRICEAFEARLYQIPDLGNLQAIEDKSSEVNMDLQDRKRVLDKNKTDIEVLLAEVGRYLEVWKWIVVREKSIYHTMNHFAADITGVLRAEGWVISTQMEKVRNLVEQAHMEALGEDGGAGNQSLPSSVTTLPETQWPPSPPTYFRTNKFTRVFQVIVDTYGVPRYQEANPAIMTVITFPFCFGVMFGDIGHGSLLFVFAAYLCWNEKKFEKMKGELIEMLYGGRYMLLLMGLFATYGGLIYNDFFAIGLRLFPTFWEEQPHDSNDDKIYFNPKPDGTVYPLGVDPVWHRASNDLLYFNSLKMKMSVCFGVTQMTIGLFHRLSNAIYFHKKNKVRGINLDLWFEALPMIIFMLALFGYMCVLIIFKWSLQWNGEEGFCDSCGRTNCCNPPALITMLINIALAIGDVPEDEQLFDNQGTVQTALLLIAVIQVPIMLIPKPWILIKRMKKEHGGAPTNAGVAHELEQQNSQTELMIDDHADGDHVQLDHQKAGHAAGGHEEEHSTGDIVIHQAIETIEFTLGCISNTASYLRLWALSLAHSQLASVFLEKALLDFVTEDGFGGVMMTFIGYAVFAGITFAVLMAMDNLECFLHALRLHWVEFQNKFFHGDGIAFTPLSFKSVLVPN